MAKDYIKVTRTDTAAVHSGQLLILIDQLRILLEQTDKVRGIMTHNNDGTDFAPLEVLFGIPTGKGQEVFDYVNGLKGVLAGTFQNGEALIFVERVG